jgi:hypothetical protein
MPLSPHGPRVPTSKPDLSAYVPLPYVHAIAMTSSKPPTAWQMHQGRICPSAVLLLDPTRLAPALPLDLLLLLVPLSGILQLPLDPACCCCWYVQRSQGPDCCCPVAHTHTACSKAVRAGRSPASSAASCCCSSLLQKHQAWHRQRHFAVNQSEMSPYLRFLCCRMKRRTGQQSSLALPVQSEWHSLSTSCIALADTV